MPPPVVCTQYSTPDQVNRLSSTPPTHAPKASALPPTYGQAVRRFLHGNVRRCVVAEARDDSRRGVVPARRPASTFAPLLRPLKQDRARDRLPSVRYGCWFDRSPIAGSSRDPRRVFLSSADLDPLEGSHGSRSRATKPFVRRESYREILLGLSTHPSGFAARHRTRPTCHVAQRAIAAPPASSAKVAMGRWTTWIGAIVRRCLRWNSRVGLVTNLVSNKR